jgi:hypothetical protein
MSLHRFFSCRISRSQSVDCECVHISVYALSGVWIHDLSFRRMEDRRHELHFLYNRILLLLLLFSRSITWYAVHETGSKLMPKTWRLRRIYYYYYYVYVKCKLMRLASSAFLPLRWWNCTKIVSKKFDLWLILSREGVSLPTGSCIGYWMYSPLIHTSRNYKQSHRHR